MRQDDRVSGALICYRSHPAVCCEFPSDSVRSLVFATDLRSRLGPKSSATNEEPNVSADMLRQLVRSFARQHRDLALGRSHSTLVLGEALHGDLTLASKASLAAAKALGHPVTLLLAGRWSTDGHSSAPVDP